MALHALVRSMRWSRSAASNPQAKSSSSGSPVLLIFVAIAAAFYFFIYRPQQRKAKAAREQANQFEVGDEVLTAGGLVGHVIDIDGERITLETSVGASFVVLKQYVLRKLEEPDPDPDVDDDDEPEFEDEAAEDDFEGHDEEQVDETAAHDETPAHDETTADDAAAGHEDQAPSGPESEASSTNGTAGGAGGSRDPAGTGGSRAAAGPPQARPIAPGAERWRRSSDHLSGHEEEAVPVDQPAVGGGHRRHRPERHAGRRLVAQARSRPRRRLVGRLPDPPAGQPGPARTPS